MKRLVVVCLLFVGGPVALAERTREAWIPLEDLTPDQQEEILDMEENERPNRANAGNWSSVTEQLVHHAEHNRQLQETGADLTPGVE